MSAIVVKEKPGISIPLVHGILAALYVSLGATLGALFVFGYIKGHFTGIRPLRGGFQTVLIGGLAAGAAFAIARLIS